MTVDKKPAWRFSVSIHCFTVHLSSWEWSFRTKLVANAYFAVYKIIDRAVARNNLWLRQCPWLKSVLRYLALSPTKKSNNRKMTEEARALVYLILSTGPNRINESELQSNSNDHKFSKQSMTGSTVTKLSHTLPSLCDACSMSGKIISTTSQIL